VRLGREVDDHVDLVLAQRRFRLCMTAQHGLRFTGFGKPLERIGARRLEEAVAGRALAFDQHHRLVDERAEVIERGPRVDAVVGHDVLRGFEREAARKHRETAECGLLIGREERVAPFERRAQRLVPAQDHAGAGPSLRPARSATTPWRGAPCSTTVSTRTGS